MHATAGTASLTEPDGHVLAMDNIPLALPVAGVGSRALAMVIDYLVVGVLGVLWTVAAVGASSWMPAWGTAWTVALFSLGFFALEYGYFAGVEALTGGRSLGKRALGLRVVSQLGGRASVGSLLVRNMVRLIDLFVGVWLVMFDPRARRLGDRLAGTLVVHERAPAAGVLVTRVPAGWSARDVGVVESLLRRTDTMDAERAQRMAQELLALVERDDAALLRDVPADLPPVERLRRAVGAV
ncbi:MAG: RDD family protein [Vicinamibacteria bacterium]